MLGFVAVLLLLFSDLVYGQEVGVDTEIQSTLLQYFDGKNQAIVNGDIPALRNKLGKVSNVALVDIAVVNVQRERAAAAKGSFSYTGSDTSVEWLGMARQGIDEISVDAIEKVALHLATNGGPDKTEQWIEHHLVISKANGSWRIISDEIVNQPGPQKPEPGFRPVPSKETTTKLANDGNTASDGAEVGIQTVYNGSAAASYAYQWALSRNPAYRSFDQDCTNFISQALRAGNWVDVPGWYLDTSAWWYNELNQSRTWINAHYWWWFTHDRPRGYIASYFSDLQLGDILQMDFDRDGYIDHSMVVTYKDSYGTIYLSYHTTDTRNRSINSILQQYPNAAYYGWRITSAD